VGALLVFALAGCTAGGPARGTEADLVLTGGRVWTGDDGRPWAEAVAIRSNRLAAVGSAAEIAALTGPDTRVMELEGRFVSPGFIDNHTHFGSAGALLLGVNLLDVADQASLIRRVREAVERMPSGAWLVRGDWGAYEAWAMGSTGAEEEAQEREPFSPHRSMIDSLTTEHPALLARWDRSAYLANGPALQAAGATCAWPGVECDAEGSMTGRLTPEAASRIQAVIPPKSLEQKLEEARVALARLRRHGVTTIHDITSADQLEVYQHLRKRGELTTRIWARPALDRWDELTEVGLLPGFGDDWIRIGGLKGYVDGIMGNSGARFYEPYLTSGEVGIWRVMMNPPGNMERLITSADSLGFWPNVHAIGDHAIDTLLTMFERVMERNGPRERRFRVIHTQVLRGPEVAERMARLGVIAEVQPYHCIDDMRWMEERIGERSRWAYAFRTLRDAGVLLSFGSDWPGTNAAWYTSNPLHGIYAGVARQTLDGEPAAGWFPEERIDVETALRAYTVNNAWAEGAENVKGSLSPGRLADLVVLDRNPLEVQPLELKDIEVEWTIVDGRIVFERAAS
jgi:predicted amidohydrolase YtcJ